MLKLFKAKSLKKTQETENISLNERTQEKNKKQRGRSMVEMLGVLAIIGVLSIGGIQGYTMAMRKYRANEILNIVQKYAMVQYSSCQLAMENNPEEYGILSEETMYLLKLQEWYDDYQDFWVCPKVEFTDSGLGAVPSGVHEIGASFSSSQNLQTLGGNGYSGVGIVSLSSGDAVVVVVAFETKELCETVMGITGKPINSRTGDTVGMLSNYADDYTCRPWGSGDKYYSLAIVTMMN